LSKKAEQRHPGNPRDKDGSWSGGPDVHRDVLEKLHYLPILPFAACYFGRAAMIFAKSFLEKPASCLQDWLPHTNGSGPPI
jgi:hypothetical protein